MSIKVGIIGGGWPGLAHAKGYRDAGGFKVVAVADLIPSRRKKLLEENAGAKEFAEADALIKEADIDVVSVCLPTHLHAPITIAALKAGRHVCCEKPPALNAKEASKIAAAASKTGKILLYAMQRRFGGAELASRQALDKKFIGDVYHVRASWMRTRGIPAGTGWFTDPARSGGGAMIDIGLHMLDLAWSLIGEPKPLSVSAVTHTKFLPAAQAIATSVRPVEDAAFGLFRFDGGRSLELAATWAINQPAGQQGTLCRIYGSSGFVDAYTPQGAMIYRGFNATGESKASALKPPRIAGHAALMRHFKSCIAGEAQPIVNADKGVVLMKMIDAFYRSATSGRSENIK